MLFSVLMAACTDPGEESANVRDSSLPHDSNPVDSDPHDTAGETGETGDTGDTGSRPPMTLQDLDTLGFQNLIIVHVDTLRADRLPQYGGLNPTLPKVGGRPQLVVDNLFSAGSWTLPSTTSALTALGIEHHGLTRMDADHVPNATVTEATMGTWFHEANVATYVGAGNSLLTRVDGLGDAFDTENTAPDPEHNYYLNGLVDDAMGWRDTLPAGKRYFIFLQPMDTHGAYDPREHSGEFADRASLPFDPGAGLTESEQVAAFEAGYAAADEAGKAAMIEAMRDLYDETILSVDDALAALFDELNTRGDLENTLVVLAADHGETIGDDLDYVTYGHGGTVRPELTHVPLVLFNPRLNSSTVDCLASNVDLAPTLLEAMGIGAPDGVDGIPLQAGCRDVVFSSTYQNNTPFDELNDIQATDGDWMLRWDCKRARVHRYDLVSDPTAQTSLDAKDVPVADALDAALHGFHAEVVDTLGLAACPAGEVLSPG